MILIKNFITINNLFDPTFRCAAGDIISKEFLEEILAFIESDMKMKVIFIPSLKKENIDEINTIKFFNYK